MNEEKKTYKVTQEDVEGLANQLEQFVQTLPEQERDVLSWIVARAAEAGAQTTRTDDTAGHSHLAYTTSPIPVYQSPYQTQISRALGLRGGLTSGVTIGITGRWSK